MAMVVPDFLFGRKIIDYRPTQRLVSKKQRSRVAKFQRLEEVKNIENRE